MSNKPSPCECNRSTRKNCKRFGGFMHLENYLICSGQSCKASTSEAYRTMWENHTKAKENEPDSEEERRRKIDLELPNGDCIHRGQEVLEVAMCNMGCPASRGEFNIYSCNSPDPNSPEKASVKKKRTDVPKCQFCPFYAPPDRE